VVAGGGKLSSPRATLSIVRGCDGAGVTFLLIAAVLAFSAGWKYKLLGAAGALVLTYALNELRVVGLYFVAAYHSEWFGLLHDYLVPTLLIVACCIFFAAWAGWAKSSGPAT